MSIVLNHYLQRTEDNKLFGKVGFQTQSEKTDRLILSNLREVEAALDAGLLRDLDGNVAKDDAVIMIYARVSRVKEGESRSVISGFRDANGALIAVPAATEEEAPFQS